MNADWAIVGKSMDRYEQLYRRLQAELEETNNLLTQLSRQYVDHMSLIQTKQKRNRIESALLRFQAGTYGTCQLCGLMIDTKRLSLLPYAELCLECQQKKEAGTL